MTPPEPTEAPAAAPSPQRDDVHPADVQSAGSTAASPGRSDLKRTLAITGALLIVLSFVLGQVAVPYVVLAPGPTSDTLGSVKGTPLITISGRPTYPAEGHLNLTTVLTTRSDSRMDLVSALSAWLDGDRAVVPREQVYPPDQSAAESQVRNAEEMTRSQVHAVAAAMKELGIEPLGEQVVVASISVGSPALDKLKAGDVILAVQGTEVSTPQDVRRLVSQRPVGSTVTVKVRRGGAVRTETITTGPAPDDPTRSLIGVAPAGSARYPVDVRIKIDDVGGPSAGLMFALGIVEKLTPEDITGGRFIAGTGTIDDNGSVGPIGGIQQKLKAARSAGAEIFLVPAEDCADAVPARPKGLRLVEVKDLKGALAALTALRNGNEAAVPSCPRS